MPCAGLSPDGPTGRILGKKCSGSDRKRSPDPPKPFRSRDPETAPKSTFNHTSFRTRIFWQAVGQAPSGSPAVVGFGLSR